MKLMNLDYNIISGKEENYIITYKDASDKEYLTSEKALSKAHAERIFFKNFNNHYDILKVQTVDEWVDETSSEIVKDAMRSVKDIGKLVEKDKKTIIDVNKINSTDYNSKSFKKGLKKINRQCEKDEEMSKPDYDKMQERFNI